MTQTEYVSNSLEQTQKIGAEIAQQLSFPACVFLQGNLGTGKTTLSKAIIQALGYQGDVTSPTYNIIQEYAVNEGTVYHMDLYRLEDPSEIEFLALGDLYTPNSIFLIEWPEIGEGYLPEATHSIKLFVKEEGNVSCRIIDLESNLII